MQFRDERGLVIRMYMEDCQRRFSLACRGMVLCLYCLPCRNASAHAGWFRCQHFDEDVCLQILGMYNQSAFDDLVSADAAADSALITTKAPAQLLLILQVTP